VTRRRNEGFSLLSVTELHEIRNIFRKLSPYIEIPRKLASVDSAVKGCGKQKSTCGKLLSICVKVVEWSGENPL
jgi:hypothetical protein